MILNSQHSFHTQILTDVKDKLNKKEFETFNNDNNNKKKNC